MLDEINTIDVTVFDSKRFDYYNRIRVNINIIIYFVFYQVIPPNNDFIGAGKSFGSGRGFTPFVDGNNLIFLSLYSSKNCR